MGDAGAGAAGARAGERDPAGAFASCHQQRRLCSSEDVFKLQMRSLELGFVGLVLVCSETLHPQRRF